jgi:hypothetical protein
LNKPEPTLSTGFRASSGLLDVYLAYGLNKGFATLYAFTRFGDQQARTWRQFDSPLSGAVDASIGLVRDVEDYFRQLNQPMRRVEDLSIYDLPKHLKQAISPGLH